LPDLASILGKYKKRAKLTKIATGFALATPVLAAGASVTRMLADLARFMGDDEIKRQSEMLVGLTEIDHLHRTTCVAHLPWRAVPGVQVTLQKRGLQ